MAPNYRYDGHMQENFRRIITRIMPKHARFILKVLFIASLVCLLVLFYQKQNLVEQIKTISVSKLDAAKAENCNFDEGVISRVKFPFSGIAIEVYCLFRDRVRVFNAALDRLRLAHLRRRHSKEWSNISAYENIKFRGTADDDFLQRLENFPQIETVFLPWIGLHTKFRAWTSLKDTSNILINDYFEWTADKELCQWIKGPVVHMYDVIHNRTCVSDIQKTKVPQSLRLLELNSKPLGRSIYWPNNGTSYPSHFYHEPPTIALYIHIIQDSIVTPNSEVWSGDMYLVQRTCAYRRDKRPPKMIDKIPMYDEVIAISQYWGEGTFHGMIEVIPRVSLYVDFLKRNPQVKILLPIMHGRLVELLTILGLSKNQVISGTCRAKLLYLPRATMCGHANVQEIQVASSLFRQYINEELTFEPRDKIILIQRSRSRKFTDHDSIERTVKEISTEHNLTFELFQDNPVPSLEKTMIMFHSAVMVIAPHGAGLSNVVFSQPGTFVIEGVCNPPHINLCYQRLSRILGHHWHGIHSRGGCQRVVDVSVSSVKTAVVKHLDFLQK